MVNIHPVGRRSLFVGLHSLHLFREPAALLLITALKTVIHEEGTFHGNEEE